MRPRQNRWPKAASIDELEQAVATAVNPESSDEELAAAGKVIEPYRETRLYDVITSNEEIDRRVELCFRLSIQSELSLKKIPSKRRIAGTRQCQVFKENRVKVVIRRPR